MYSWSRFNCILTVNSLVLEMQILIRSFYQIQKRLFAETVSPKNHDQVSFE